jgi:squalene-hopene/tetraprenyl-beta-curcumene cyclase
LLGVVVAGWGLGSAAAGEPVGKPLDFPPPGPNSAAEPVAKEFALAKGAAFLDAAAVHWTRTRKCVTCHTNAVYLMARPALKEGSRGEREVREFLRGQVAGWDSGDPKAKPRGDAYVVATAVALAAHDAQTTGKLHPLTRKALGRMWSVQNKHGAWDWLKCNWPPLEHDDYFGAVFAAVGVGLAPEGYAGSDEARAGLARLKAYLKREAPPTLHHKAWLVWASLKLDGLLTAAERGRAVKELLALQRADGGWSLPSLGDWKGFDGRENDTKAASDGYGTGLVVFVLRQAGLAKGHAAVKRGVAWLKANQRASGRWFTKSLNTDRSHYITHAGTAFALLALKACE